MKRYFGFILLAALAIINNGCSGTDPGKRQEDSNLVLTATFANPSSPVAQSTWAKDGKVSFMVVKGGNSFKDLMIPQSVSADGTTATFSFSSFFPTDADAYCAYIVGAGADAFVSDNAVHVPAVSTNTSADFPVTVAYCGSSDRQMSFAGVYSHICFKIEENGISHVILEGKGAEIVSSACIVSLKDMKVTPDPASPVAETSLRKDVYGPGSYYIPLFPGIEFERGYRLTAYSTSGRAVMTAEYDGRLSVESGRIYAAPAFKETGEETSVFDAANVECSFGVLSDTHIDATNGGNCQTKLASAFSQLKGQALKDDPDGIDGIFIAGDLINNGASGRSYYDTEIKIFKTIYEAAFDPMKVPMIYAMGNHDPYGWWGQRAGTDVYSESRVFKQTFGDKYGWMDKDASMRDAYECRHCVVGNYHILCVTPNAVYPVSYPAAVTEWLDRTLASVTSADPERYVVLLTHPMIYNTVYGSLLGPDWMMGSCSDYWYTKGLTSVLDKYPQVMTFSGHLHFPVNDPRSIWQGSFTSFGCGSSRYMAIEDGRYENMSSATVMSDANDISSGLLLQFDRSGNARITKMFFSQNITFDYPWELKHPSKDGSHLDTYNHAALRAKNSAPSMAAPEVSLSSTSTQLKAVNVKFYAGEDDEFVHHYVLTLRKAGAVVATKRILSDFYRHQWFSGMAKSHTVQMGNFGSGDYTLTVDAYDSWDAHGSATTSFSINSPVMQ